MASNLRSNKVAWFFFVFFLGNFAIDKFVVGQTKWGIIKLVTCIIGVGLVINFIEAILVLAGKYQDAWPAYFGK